MRICKICEEDYYALGYCRKHYDKLRARLGKNDYASRNREKIRRYPKEYNKQEHVKLKRRRYAKEYYKRPYVKARVKEIRKTYVSLKRFEDDFMEKFMPRIRNIKDFYETATDYSHNACELSNRKGCELEKRILTRGMKEKRYRMLKENEELEEKYER